MVQRVTIALDCGTVVNPNDVHAAMEGGIIYGLSAALKGEITITRGSVDQGNFDDYPVLRGHEVPDIEVHIISSDEPPGSIGDIAQILTAPAVVNAIARKTGHRIRKLPMGDQVLS